MNSIWCDVKAYFGDGFLAHSSPIRFNKHCCDMQPKLAKNENVFYGVEINEDVMPLFSALGETCVPTCSCEGIEGLRQYIEEDVKIAPSTNPGDYSLYTGKGDASFNKVCLYAMRDSIQWWSNWHGSLDGHHWKHLYIAFSTIPDDIQIPPQHLVDGTFRFLGNSLSDILTGLHSEKVHPFANRSLIITLSRTRHTSDAVEHIKVIYTKTAVKYFSHRRSPTDTAETIDVAFLSISSYSLLIRWTLPSYKY